MPDHTALLTVTAFLIAGFVKGVIGLGLPTIAMAVMALVLPPAQAAALLIVPAFATNVWQALAGPNLLPIVSRLWVLLIAAVAGTLAGAGLLTGPAAAYAPAGLGAAMVLYGGLGLASVRLTVPRQREWWLSPLIGLMTGLVTAATGVFLVPGVIYVQALGFDKEELVQALGLAFTIATLALAGNLALSGAFHPTAAGSSLLALVPALAGMYLGQLARALLSEATFRTLFFAGVLVLGAYLIARTVL